MIYRKILFLLLNKIYCYHKNVRHFLKKKYLFAYIRIENIKSMQPVFSSILIDHTGCQELMSSPYLFIYNNVQAIHRGDNNEDARVATPPARQRMLAASS